MSPYAFVNRYIYVLLLCCRVPTPTCLASDSATATCGTRSLGTSRCRRVRMHAIMWGTRWDADRGWLISVSRPCSCRWRQPLLSLTSCTSATMSRAVQCGRAVPGQIYAMQCLEGKGDFPHPCVDKLRSFDDTVPWSFLHRLWGEHRCVQNRGACSE
jgi:hypothetical protein